MAEEYDSADCEESRCDMKRLKKEIKRLSHSNVWKHAKREWRLMTIYDLKNRCLCGHRILENCEIFNEITGRTAIVGNVCINHFKESRLAVEPKCRASLRKVHAKKCKKANEFLVELAERVGIITGPQARSYNKLKKSDTSDEKKMIEQLIMLGFDSKRPKCQCGDYAKPRQNTIDKGYFYSCPNGSYVEDKWISGCKFSKSVK